MNRCRVVVMWRGRWVPCDASLVDGKCSDPALHPVDSPLGLTEQQHADSALNEMIETLPAPLKNMSGMYNGMTARPVPQPVDNPVDNYEAGYADPRPA